MSRHATLRVGVTASRYASQPAQYGALARLLAVLDVAELHHGDCVGGDADAHALALSYGIPVIVHPPVRPELRTFSLGAYAYRTARDYHERNRAIVDDTTLLIAVPTSAIEQLRSGTWSTVRYARSLQKPVALVFPDGGIAIERISSL